MNVVFLGPTLPLGTARRLCDAVFLPPARRGDIMAAIERLHPRTIALIDGYFEQVPAVWHKEILFALAQGIEVAGAASMGALRAAELRAFGMRGIGRIFDAYVAGRFAPFEDPFEDDDEVAVVHAPIELGYAASDAMVDIRATLAAAADAGVIGADDAQAIAGIAKALFYKDRRYAAVLEAAAAGGIEATTLSALEAWLGRGRVAQKQLDAEALLRQLAQGELAGAPPAFRFERTLLWENAFLSDEARVAAGSGDGA